MCGHKAARTVVTLATIRPPVSVRYVDTTSAVSTKKELKEQVAWSCLDGLRPSGINGRDHKG